jgi:hypothetical protein
MCQPRDVYFYRQVDMVKIIQYASDLLREQRETPREEAVKIYFLTHH